MRGRPPLPIGTCGTIRIKQIAPGRWQASCYFRDRDGVTRQIKRRGRSRSAANSNLQQAMADRVPPTMQGITAESTVAELADVWKAEKVAEDAAANSMKTYGTSMKHIKAEMSNRRLREVTAGSLDAWIKRIGKTHPTKARMCRTVLTGMFDIAVRVDALDVNPARGTARARKSAKNVRALSLDEVSALRAHVKSWVVEPHLGPARDPAIIDIVDAMLGTGCRIGEILAIRWDDVDLDARTVHVCGTVVRTEKTVTESSRLIRQPHPKTSTSDGVLKLPPFMVAMLLRRSVAAPPVNAWNVVFPSAAGTLREPNNVERTWRAARGKEWSWVKPHTFRKTVATLLDEELDSKAAADQLRHANEDTTRRHYIQETHQGPDARAQLERLGPGPHENK